MNLSRHSTRRVFSRSSVFVTVALVVFAILVGSCHVANTANLPTVPETVQRFGLIGIWAVKCSSPPSTLRNPVIISGFMHDGRVVIGSYAPEVFTKYDLADARLVASKMIELRTGVRPLVDRFSIVEVLPGGRQKLIEAGYVEGPKNVEHGFVLSTGLPTTEFERCAPGDTVSRDVETARSYSGISITAP